MKNAKCKMKSKQYKGQNVPIPRLRKFIHVCAVEVVGDPAVNYIERATPR